jgi:hypothetical protein
MNEEVIMAYKSVVISTIISIILIISIFKIYALFHRPLVHHLNEEIQLLGIIDSNDPKDISSHSILEGENSLLIIDHASLLYQKLLQKIPQVKYLTPEELFNVNNLHLFDNDSNGILTSKDAIFEHLFILRFYNKGQQDDIKSLTAAGVQGINTAKTSAGNYEILMADCTKHTLYSANKIEKNT